MLHKVNIAWRIVGLIVVLLAAANLFESGAGLLLALLASPFYIALVVRAWRWAFR